MARQVSNRNGEDDLLESLLKSVDLAMVDFLLPLLRLERARRPQRLILVAVAVLALAGAVH